MRGRRGCGGFGRATALGAGPTTDGALTLATASTARSRPRQAKRAGAHRGDGQRPRFLAARGGVPSLRHRCCREGAPRAGWLLARGRCCFTSSGTRPFDWLGGDVRAAGARRAPPPKQTLRRPIATVLPARARVIDCRRLATRHLSQLTDVQDSLDRT